MRIAVFSDIHGNQYSLKIFRDEIKSENVDLIVFLGDIFGYYYGQHECIEILSKMERLICLLGNHDLYFLNLLNSPEMETSLVSKYGSSYTNKFKSLVTKRDIDFLKTMKTSYSLTCNDLKLFFCHGTPLDYLNGRLYPDGNINLELADLNYDYIFLGHTHHKMLRKLNNITVANPGSLGQQRDGKGCSYLIFDSQDLSNEYKNITFDMAPLLKEIELNDPEKENLKSVLLRKS